VGLVEHVEMYDLRRGFDDRLIDSVPIIPGHLYRPSSRRGNIPPNVRTRSEDGAADGLYAKRSQDSLVSGDLRRGNQVGLMPRVDSGQRHKRSDLVKI
jgi:hypothetical protein